MALTEDFANARRAIQIAIGPIEMGSTSSIPGIWQILYKLDQLLSWGESEYKAWFETEVMAWAEKLAADR